MGQCVSAAPEHKGSPTSRRKSSTRGRFYRSKNGNLSATFHVLDADMRWDLLNVNTATEEQLMTLPGINRSTAENILEYRQRIGGFKKVEDLALVSGVGATKLEQFRTEVCVGKRKNNSSHNSSLTQSLESLQVVDNFREPKLVNVNTANVFQLMSVCRMTQEMAANIVHHRDKKGPFRTLSDLSRVKNLPPDRLATVKAYLSTDSSVTSVSMTNGSAIRAGYGPRPIGHRRTSSAPGGLSKSRSSHYCDPSTRDFYELVSSLVTRPNFGEPFRFEHSGREVLRLASWKLQDFVVQKARNPGVQEVICRTVLENGLSILAVQEIASREALSLVASELNDPVLYQVQSWRGERGRWHSLIPAAQPTNGTKRPLVNGFLYDTSRGLQLQGSESLHLPPEKLMGLTITCQPFVGRFTIKNLEFAVVTFSLVSETCVAKLLPSILEQLRDKVKGMKNIFLVGDFILPPGHTVFEVLCSQGYTNLTPAENSPSDSTWPEETHIWSSLNVRKIFSGQSGVVKEGLCHLAIPDGWKWGGSVSKHCPVWAELFTDPPPTPTSNSTPLMNGTAKAPIVILDAKHAAKEGRDKKNHTGFWSRSWSWRNGNSKNSVTDNVISETNNVQKGNGSL